MVVLIAIDGVRPDDVFSAEAALPNLHQMWRRSAALGQPGSAGFFASGPHYVSLPGYLEVLTGNPSRTCQDNLCAPTKDLTLLDDFFLADHGAPAVAAFSSWPGLARACSPAQRGIASCGRNEGYGHHYLEANSECAGWLQKGREDRRWPDGFRADALTAELCLAYLSSAQPNFTFVSLGETDEYAHLDDRGGYERALEYSDEFVGRVQRQLDTVAAQGRSTVLLVTTDHGRATNFRDHGREHPESAASFLLAEGATVAPTAQRCGVPGHLCDIAPTVRFMCGLPSRPSQGRVLTEITGPIQEKTGIK
jgi:hypothetical protein